MPHLFFHRDLLPLGAGGALPPLSGGRGDVAVPKANMRFLLDPRCWCFHSVGRQEGKGRPPTFLRGGVRGAF